MKKIRVAEEPKMKNREIKFISFMLCLMLCLSSTPAFAASAVEQTEELLFVVDDSLYNELYNELNHPTIIVDESQVDYYLDSEIDISESIITNFNLFDYISVSDVSESMINDYKAIALPIANDELMEVARVAYNQGVLVYLYGQLTINDYKEYVSIESFTLSTKLYDSNETVCDTVEQGFDADFESTEIYNVICYSNNTLMCKFGDTPKNVNYLVAALNNCIETNVGGKTRATIVQSAFDFTTYWGTNNQFASHLDYTLYREMDELDSTYDYFAIKTRTWVTCGSAKVTGIMTKYGLPFSSDNLLETGPESQSNIGSLSGSIGFGDGKVNGSIGYSIDLSDQNPTIERTEDYSADTVEWILTPRTWFPKSINDAFLVCVASWASTGKYAGIDVSYQGVVNIGSNSQYPTSAGYTEIPVRFSYSD